MQDLSCLAGQVKKKSARSLLNGALVRSAATQQLAQITFGEKNRRGRRQLEFQVALFLFLIIMACALLLVFCNLSPLTRKGKPHCSVSGFNNAACRCVCLASVHIIHVVAFRM